MKISKVENSDIKEIVETESKLLTSSLGYDFILADLKNAASMYYKIHDDELIGYLGFRIHDNQAEMLNFVIKEKYQNQGLGTKLLSFCLDELMKKEVTFVSLDVRENNLKAINFYEKNGFKLILRKEKYYHNIDALLYGKNLKKEDKK